MRHDYRHAKTRARFKRYRCRCRHCERRKTFRRHPDQIRRLPNCSRCRRSAWRVDWYRTTRRDSRAAKCVCAAWPFPHRRGSEKQSRLAA